MNSVGNAYNLRHEEDPAPAGAESEPPVSPHDESFGDADNSLAAIANLLAGPASSPGGPLASQSAAKYEIQLESGYRTSVPLPKSPQSEEEQSGPAQVSMRQALRATSQAYKEIENLQCELTIVRERLQRTEQTQLGKSLSLTRQLAVSEAQADALRGELAEALTAKDALESRSPMGGVSVWMVIAAVIAAVTVYALMVPKVRSAEVGERQGSAFMATKPLVRNENASVHADGGAGSNLQNRSGQSTGNSGDSISGSSLDKALERLDEAIESVPMQEAGALLREANRRLEAAGFAPCMTTLLQGRPSLVISANKDKPLAVALESCADVIEQITH